MRRALVVLVMALLLPACSDSATPTANPFDVVPPRTPAPVLTERPEASPADLSALEDFLEGFQGSEDQPAPSPECVPSSEAGSAVGQRAIVCGPVSQASYRPDVNGQPTFINFDRPFPNHTFVAVIWGESRGQFNPPPERQFSPGRSVCVEGLVESYQGTPEIEVDDHNQIWVC